MNVSKEYGDVIRLLYGVVVFKRRYWGLILGCEVNGVGGDMLGETQEWRESSLVV